EAEVGIDIRAERRGLALRKLKGRDVADHRCVVGAHRRFGEVETDAETIALRLHAFAQAGVAAYATTDRDDALPQGARGTDRLAHEHIDHGFLERRAEVRE